MASASSAILGKMLDRLFASLVNGPGLNCRPHSSRQRIDLSALSRLRDVAPEELLRELLGESRRVRATGRAQRPKRMPFDPRRRKSPRMAEEQDPAGTDPAIELSEEERRIAREWSDQSSLLSKLRAIAEDARTYEQDTGVHVLNIGFPLLSMPPGGNAGRGFLSRRITAPIAFIPVTLEVKSGSTVAVEIGCKGDGVDLVRPNIALLAWLEQQTGKRTPELFDDKEAENPWREIQELVGHVARSLGLEIPGEFAGGEALSREFALVPAPRSDDEQAAGRILPAAVLGLFPMANEGLLRDTQAMVAGESLEGPVRSFLDVDVSLAAAPEERPDALAGGNAARSTRRFAEERLVAPADPCQARAALMARTTAGLVIHGPPGTGKSQTITNIIGDHLARGQRVLMVCDKRTALDVVAHRLEHLGFGPLLALVHDPQRDQRDLYRKIRETLEALPENRTRSTAARELDKVDAELQALHHDLSGYFAALMASPPAGPAGDAAPSFHDLMGEWLALPDAAYAPHPAALGDAPWDAAGTHERLLRELLERALSARYPGNPWVGAAALPLRDYLAQPAQQVRALLEPCVEAARQAQIAVDAVIPALGEGDLAAQGELRLEIAERLEALAALDQPGILRRWSGATAGQLGKATKVMDAQSGFAEALRSGPKLDGELWLAVKGSPPTIGTITASIGKLNEYLEIARKWYAFLPLAAKRPAREVLTPLGLSLNAANAERARTFLTALRARLALQDLCRELAGEGEGGALPDDEALDAALRAHAQSIALLSSLRGADRQALAAVVHGVLADPATVPAIVTALRQAAARAQALRQLEDAMAGTHVFTPGFLQKFSVDIRVHPDVAPARLEALVSALPTLEHILRIRDALMELPAPLRAPMEGLLQKSVEADAGVAALKKSLLAAEIARRLRGEAALQSMDGQRLKSTFDRYRMLEDAKRTLSRDAALHHWVSRQKGRLLAGTLSRVSPLGADLRRRLLLRGERAMRLRQVIDVGADIPDGDPLFDMCPVWMASPETVAQIFPRQPLFDVVIFDEASQCRLEEALPVLTRGKRIVVAGDPKQLPPTRFFESAITASQDDDIDGDQGLFEKQQGEIEDLLTAALNLSIENAYLDVHYRSRNSDLIAFSNAQFYHHRLQAIPGHPKNATRFCPLTLYRAAGVYEDNQNPSEAELVTKIVRDLLKRAEPPSIGIACFNLKQRDLIVEALDELATQDADFAGRLAAARTRRGAGSFEGLFVKNLENVQGDERDHIIISTTYGPTPEGRFFQRFGPLGRAGGGRRLNVLVTRAREEVHLVTSIPPEFYRALPPVPEGQTPGGAYLLYSYLQFAEMLTAAYARESQAADDRPVPAAGALPVIPPQVTVHPRRNSLPSRFAEALAENLATAHNVGSQVHWGNDGFCIDLALAHPHRPDDVTIGILCDANRYLNAPDAVEWDLFRQGIHESQGWTLHRLWTPQFFRDPPAASEAILQEVRRHLASETPQDAIGVVPTQAPQPE
ncbi:MAG TPA: AAA domain-containing protein [Phycisphaerae bacterium]|nr:AAA domain-containing protein [Phycisphaerae bacterium]